MANIVVRRRRVLDDLNRTRLVLKLDSLHKDDPVMEGEMWDWVSMVTGTEIVDGYTLPDPLGTSESIAACFEAYLALDSTRAAEWKRIYNAAQQPTNAGALVPQLSDDEKKSTPSAASNTE